MDVREEWQVVSLGFCQLLFCFQGTSSACCMLWFNPSMNSAQLSQINRKWIMISPQCTKTWELREECSALNQLHVGTSGATIKSDLCCESTLYAWMNNSQLRMVGCHTHCHSVIVIAGSMEQDGKNLVPFCRNQIIAGKNLVPRNTKRSQHQKSFRINPNSKAYSMNKKNRTSWAVDIEIQNGMMRYFGEISILNQIEWNPYVDKMPLNSARSQIQWRIVRDLHFQQLVQ